MKHVALVAPWVSRNEIFDIHSRTNRDDTFQPYYELKNALKKLDIDINTADLCLNNIDAELHQDVQRSISGTKKILLLLETDMIHPRNKFSHSKYETVLTWNDDFIGKSVKYKKINYPNILTPNTFIEWDKKSRFISMMCANKIAPGCIGELYSERYKIIRWFAQNHSEDLDLYGDGWNLPRVNIKYIGKPVMAILRRMNVQLLNPKLSIYKGIALKKSEIYNNSKFAICLENSSMYNGYITEKIFDAFVNGCVPIYLGAKNISDYVPSNTYINYGNFDTISEMYDYLKSIDAKEYATFQENIYNFLVSKDAEAFNITQFVDNVKQSIVDLFGMNKNNK